MVLIISHNNSFNKAILKKRMHFIFEPSRSERITFNSKKEDYSKHVQNNFDTIINEFNWDKINGDYLRLFEKSILELKSI
jgi:hypothetical protein